MGSHILGRVLGALLISSSIGCTTPGGFDLETAPNTGVLFTESMEHNALSDIGVRSRTATLTQSWASEPLSPTEEPLHTLVLNIFDDVSVEATRTQWTHLPNGGWSWHGVQVGDPYSEITLVQMQGVLAGNIRTSTGTYQIRSHSSQQVTIEEVNPSLLPGDEEIVPADDFAHQESDGAPSQDTEGDAGPIIDVLVIYTGAARDGAGNGAAMEAEVALAIAETNDGYLQSGVNQRVRLVETAITSWNEKATEFSFYDTLVKVTNPTDGVMDEVHTLRDAVGADEVVVIVEGDSSYCGLAWLMDTPSAAFADYAFSVVARNCATGNYSFAHELGHNMGSTHDHNNADSGAYSHSFGMQLPEAGVRTVMAYSCPTTRCRRLNRWSNPDQIWGEAALGVSGDGADAADNRRSLNRTADIVSRFRDTVDLIEPQAPDLLSPASGMTLPSSSVSVVLSNVDADQYLITVGNTLGGADLGRFDLRDMPNGTIDGLPTDGRGLFVRAWARHGETWSSSDHTFTAHTEEVINTELPEMVTPLPGATLSTSTITFTWTETTASQIVVRLGRTPDDAAIGQFGVGTKTSFTARRLPLNGEVLWLSLYAKVNGSWQVQYFQYKTKDLSADIQPATFLSPTPDAAIHTNVTFTWSTPCACTYILNLRDADGTLVATTEETELGRTDLTDLPLGEHITAQLFTLSEAGTFLREADYFVQ